MSKLSLCGIWGLVFLLKATIFKVGGLYSSKRKASRACLQNTGRCNYLTLKAIIKECSSVRKKKKGKKAKRTVISDSPEARQLNRFADLWL